MFLSLDQPRVFAVCLIIGIISGVFYEVFGFIICFIKQRLIKHAIKFVWVILCLPIFITISYLYEFPDFRGYMALGVALGIYLYKLSFHKVFAILQNKVYNIITKLVKNKRSRHERSKKKANIFGGTVGIDNVDGDSGVNNLLPVSRNIHKKKQNSRA